MLLTPIPVLGFAAFSGTGKTTLLTQLIPLLKQTGLQIGLVKHSHHDFEIDHPGKDSYRLRKAGADQVMLVSRHRWAMISELRTPHIPRLVDQLQHLDLAQLDLILVEGFKAERFPKIELHRAALNKPLLFPADPSIIAVASDRPMTVPEHLALLDLNDPQMIAEFILHYIPGVRHD